MGADERKAGSQRRRGEGSGGRAEGLRARFQSVAVEALVALVMLVGGVALSRYGGGTVGAVGLPLAVLGVLGLAHAVAGAAGLTREPDEPRPQRADAPRAAARRGRRGAPRD